MVWWAYLQQAHPKGAATNIALGVLGFLGRLVLTWFLTEFVRNFLSGTGFGVVELSFAKRLPAMARPAIALSSRELAVAAHNHAAKFSIPLCLIGTVVTRIVWRDRGNFDLLSVGLPIVAGIAVGTPIGIRAFKRSLISRFGNTMVKRRAPPPDERSALAMQKSGTPWVQRAVERAQTDEGLRRKIQRAVMLWDTFESYGGDVLLTVDELFDSDTLQQKMKVDPLQSARRASTRESVMTQFEVVLTEIAADVARLEGKPRLEAECHAALYHGFFDLAEALRM